MGKFMKELKPCPFCGYMVDKDFKVAYPGKQYRVICSNCRTAIGWYPTQGLADKAWNKRK